MRIVAAKHFRMFATNHPRAKTSVEYWLRVTRQSSWKSAQDVLRSFPSAKVIDADRVRFELAGNTCRLICAIYYPAGVVFVKFLGAHKEYDAINAKTVKMF